MLDFRLEKEVEDYDTEVFKTYERKDYEDVQADIQSMLGAFRFQTVDIESPVTYVLPRGSDERYLLICDVE